MAAASETLAENATRTDELNRHEDERLDGTPESQVGTSDAAATLSEDNAAGERERTAGEPTASFSVANPLQGVPPATAISVSVLAVGALLVRWLAKVHKRKAGKRARRASAWAWQSEELPQERDAKADLSTPLLGTSLAVAQKYALRSAFACSTPSCCRCCCWRMQRSAFACTNRHCCARPHQDLNRHSVQRNSVRTQSAASRVACQRAGR